MGSLLPTAPSWGALSSIGGIAKVVLAALWAGAIVFVVGRVIVGAAKQSIGGRSHNSLMAEEGKSQFLSGLVGLLVLGSITALTTLVYSLGLS